MATCVVTIKLSAIDGSVVWTKVYQGQGATPDDAWPIDLKVDPSGNAVVTGYALDDEFWDTTPPYRKTNNSYTVKYSSQNGSTQWEKFDDLGTIIGLAVDSQGDAIISSQRNRLGAGRDWLTTKYSGLGIPDIALLDPNGIDLTHNSSAYSFGSVAIGIPAEKPFTIRNDGSGPLNSLSASTLGVNASNYTVSSFSSTSLAAGKSMIVRVTFTPTASTTQGAVTLQIQSNDGDEAPFNVTLNGSGETNADGDLASDEWELNNGFSPSVSDDVATLDSDNDGDLDILEIFQGTEPNSPNGNFNSRETQVSSTNPIVLNTQFRRSKTQSAVEGIGKWSIDMNTWYFSGETVDGVTVTITEDAADMGDHELVDVSVCVS